MSSIKLEKSMEWKCVSQDKEMICNRTVSSIKLEKSVEWKYVSQDKEMICNRIDLKTAFPKLTYHLWNKIY